MKKIMLVDDDEGILESAASILKSEGFEVITAKSGEECLEKLREIRPDCIILDVIMPDMDGWRVLRRIKDDKALSSIPVIMLTVRPASTEMLRGKMIKGYADYLMKPFTKEAIMKSLLRIGISARS